MRKLFVIPVVVFVLAACNSGDKSSASDNKMVSGSADSTTKKAPAAYEWADQKYVDMAKQQLSQFEQGNIDAWLSSFSDNAKYFWSGGDSLVGKKAITDYWKNRRGTVIKAINFTNQIWFPIKINTPQTDVQAPGNWTQSYYKVNVTYNNGKSLQFWTHTVQHYDASDKVDQVVQFIDYAPINKALGK